MSALDDLAMIERALDHAREIGRDLRSVLDVADKHIMLLASKARAVREALGLPAPSAAAEDQRKAPDA